MTKEEFVRTRKEPVTQCRPSVWQRQRRRQICKLAALHVLSSGSGVFPSGSRAASPEPLKDAAAWLTVSWRTSAIFYSRSNRVPANRYATCCCELRYVSNSWRCWEQWEAWKFWTEGCIKILWFKWYNKLIFWIVDFELLPKSFFTESWDLPTYLLGIYLLYILWYWYANLKLPILNKVKTFKLTSITWFQQY